MNNGLLKNIMLIIGAIVLIGLVLRLVGVVVQVFLPVAIVIVAIYIVYSLLTGKRPR